MKSELSYTRYRADAEMMDATGHNGGPGKLALAGAANATNLPARLSRSARDRRFAWLLLAAWVINLFDLGLTVLAWRNNLMVELNPLAAKILPHGTLAIVAFKIGLVFLGTASLWYCRRHWAAEPAIWAYVIICFALSLWWHRLINEMHVSWAEYSTPISTQPLVPENSDNPETYEDATPSPV